MKTPLLTSFLSVAGVASLALLLRNDAAAQTTVATAPVGYLQTSCLSNSDTLVAPPFLRPAAFVGAVSSTSTNTTTGTGTITLGSASLTADAFDAPTTTPPTKDTYYVLIGPATATLTGTVTVTQGSTTVTGNGTTFGTDVKAGDRLTINDGYNLLTYTVVSIESPTGLTLDRAFADSAAPTNSMTSGGKTTAVKTTGVRPMTANKLAITSPMASGSSLSGLSATYDHSPYEGRFYQVASNSTNNITVNLNGDTLTSVAAGTQVSVVPYWTLNSIYPSTNAGISFTASPSVLTRHTQIFIPNYSGVGTDLAAAANYYFVNDSGSNVGWRLFGDPSNTTDHGYDPLLPDGYFIVRNDSSSPTLPVTFSGTVPINRQAVTIATNSAAAQDNAVGLNRPADVTLSALGLTPSNYSFRSSSSVLSRTDQLFVYSNSRAATNRAASAVYYYLNDGTNSGWRLFGDVDPTTDRGSDIIPAGSALTIRKVSASGAAQNPVWINSPNY